jgi:glutathione S-transferase
MAEKSWVGARVRRALDVTSSLATTLLSGAGGRTAQGIGPRPKERLVLYDFESCPFCRKVRELLSDLDLEVEIRPCPKGGRRFRLEAGRRGGREQFPFLVDPNTSVEMYESEEILQYLVRQYGNGRFESYLRASTLKTIFGSLASLQRMGAGTWARSGGVSESPPKLLELWSFEASPFCRLVREALCELELPYILHNVASESPSRAEFLEISGQLQVPFLRDPNTGRTLFESADIVEYVHETYGETQ